MKKIHIFISLFAILLLASLNTFAQECLFICHDSIPDSNEQFIVDTLGAWGYTINPVSQDDLGILTEEEIKAYDFAFASEEIGSSSLAPLKLMPVPLVNSEPWASKPDALGWCDTPTAGNLYQEPVLIVDDIDHPLAAGHKKGDIVELVRDDPGDQIMVFSIPSIDIIPIGVSASDIGRYYIYGIEAGTETFDGYEIQNRAATVGIHAWSYPSLTDVGWEFFRAACLWVLEEGVRVDQNSVVPTDFELAQNYPNPFNPTTEIQFNLKTRLHTNLTVYNAQGQVIETLVDEVLNIGEHRVTFNAAGLPTGVYFYKIQSGENNSVRKMLLMR